MYSILYYLTSLSFNFHVITTKRFKLANSVVIREEGQQGTVLKTRNIYSIFYDVVTLLNQINVTKPMIEK